MKTKAISVPPETLNHVASPATKYKHMIRERLLLKYRLNLGAEPIKAARHVGHAGGDPDLGPGRKLDHFCKLSRTARTSDRSAPLSTLIMARPGNSI